MAKIVLGMGTSHTPMLSMPPENWEPYGATDKTNPNMVFIVPPDGKILTYGEMEERRATTVVMDQATPEVFHAQYARCQTAIGTLEKALADANPDVVVIVSDDQEELFFDDNMPSIAIFWGDKMTNEARSDPGGPGVPSEALASAMWGYGSEDVDVPVDSELGLHLIEQLISNDFDVSHARYMKNEYGGIIGPAGYIHKQIVTESRHTGMPHGYAFVVTRIMNGNIVPIVPIFQNTCYPPNQPTPRRCYALGQEIRRAIEAWDSDKRVAIVASGGLSHFVTDEEIDRAALRAMKDKDRDAIGNLPLHRLNSATSEIRNWITVAGAMENREMDLLDYVPVYRNLGGTGGGWGFALWR